MAALGRCRSSPSRVLRGQSSGVGVPGAPCAPSQGSAGTGSKCEGQQGRDLVQCHTGWQGGVLGWDWRRGVQRGSSGVGCWCRVMLRDGAVYGSRAVPGAAVPTVMPAAVQHPVRCGGDARCGYTWCSAAWCSACRSDAQCGTRCHDAQCSARCGNAQRGTQHGTAQFGAGVVPPGTVPGFSARFGAWCGGTRFGAAQHSAQLGFVPG